MNDLEDLVRNTLAGRAATVTHGPELTAPPAGRRNTRWLVSAAAAAVVAAAGTAFAVTHALGRHHDEAAGGSARPTCTTSLPPAWKHALAGPTWTVGGLAAWPAAVAKDGTVIAATKDGRGTYRTTLITPAGRMTPLLALTRSRHHTIASADTDGRYAVLSLDPGDADPEHPADEILLVDSRTGDRRNLLSSSLPVPSDYVVAWRAAVIQAGVVYWGMTEPVDAPAHGIVLAYDIARRRYRVLARLHAQPLVLRDPRGVHWQGGLIAARGVPAVVPVAPLGPDWRQSVISDGTTYAWQGPTGAPDAQVVYSVHRAEQRHWRVAGPRGLGQFIASAVSGPFVFGSFSYGSQIMYVLDLRSGAMASLGARYVNGAVAARSRVFVDFQSKRGTVRSVPIDAPKLPELHC